MNKTQVQIMYCASDGQTFTDKDHAEEYERKLILQNFFKDFCYSEEGAQRLIDRVCEEADFLADILLEITSEEFNRNLRNGW